MDKPLCPICKVKHRFSEPHEFPKEVQHQGKSAPSSEVLGVGQDSTSKPKKERAKREGCTTCGATPETFEDAEKWRAQRAKRKAYMRRWRKGK